MSQRIVKLRQSSFRFKVIWFKAWAPRFGFMGTVPSKSVEDLGLCITGTWNPAHPASSELYRSIQTMGLLFASASFLSPKLQQAYHQINGMQAMSWDFAESPLNCLLWIIKYSFSITFFFPRQPQAQGNKPGWPRHGGKWQGCERPRWGCSRALGRAGSAADGKAMLTATFARGKPQLWSEAYGEGPA